MEEVGVPVDCVGRLPRKSEFNTIDEYSSAIVKSLEEFSKSNCKPFQKVIKIQYQQITATEFWKSYARMGMPVVLTGAAQSMGYDLNTWSLKGLTEAYPDYPISLREGGEKNGEYDLVETKETTLSSYIKGPSKVHEARCENDQDDDGEKMYGANNFIHPDLVKKIVLPDIGYPSHVYRLMDTRIWISSPSCNIMNGAALHQDLQDNAVLMLDGNKSFYLQPPHRVTDAMSVTPFLRSGSNSNSGEDGGSIRIDLNPGDLLYLPAGWWHRTQCLPCNGTVSINFFMSACFASLGVVVPKLVNSDWLVNDEDKWNGPMIHCRSCTKEDKVDGDERKETMVSVAKSALRQPIGH
jgi:hypothetical protein